MRPLPPQVCVWDLRQTQGARVASGAWVPPGPDGLYAPLQASGAAVNALAACGGQLVTGHEDGCLCVLGAL